MGYFRTLTNSSFKLDSKGNTIFFPWGILGKGYVLPNNEIEEKIRRFLTAYYLIGLTLILIIGGFLYLWVVAILLIPFSFIIWWIQAKRYIKGLDQSSEKLSIKDNMKSLFTNDNR